MARGASSDRGGAEMPEMNRLGRFRAWVTQSGFRLFSFSLVIGLLAGVFWGCGMWFSWNMTALLAPHWGISVERLNSWEGIIHLAKPSLGFGLTMAGVMWLLALWLRGRMERRTNSSQDTTP
jgi:hypothetical protein